MTLNEIVTRAASAYPDAFVLQYWDAEKQAPRANPFGGDTLAQFCAQELADTYDEEADDREQLATAIRAMRSAAADISAVAAALENLATERKASDG